MAKAKFPKDIGGVEIPADVRRAADALIKRVDSRLGREALAAGMTLAAAAVIAVSGSGKVSFEFDDDDDAPDAPEPPEPPTAPVPPTPPVPPVPPVSPVPPEPPVRPEPLRPQPRASGMSPAQAQAMADALGNVAQAALARFMSSKRGF